jgi:ABC-type taurine transport system ATPase subunit
MVAGLDTPSSGEITLEGVRVTGPGADRGMVFQSYTLFPWLNVLENVCFGLREKGLPLADQHEIAHKFLKQVGLQDFAKHFPKQLSERPWRDHWQMTRASCSWMSLLAL